MENLDNILINEPNHIFNNLDNISRCPECNLISSLKLYYRDGKPIINFLCENNHKGNIPLDEYMNKYNNHSLIRQKCEECNKNQNEDIFGLSYCCKCDIFLCYSCVRNHQNHNIIDFKRYDSLCKIHSYFFNSYCKKCKNNICVYCYPQHEFHEQIDLFDLIYDENSKNKFEKDIKNIEKTIIDLDNIKEEIISEIDKLKKLSELEIKFFKLLIYTYKYEENHNNLNYNAIQNLKNFEEIFRLNICPIYEKISEVKKKFISSLQKIRKRKECIDQTNLMKINSKILKNHTNWISHLSQLNDGRFISSSGDGTINIYKKYSFELQLSIKKHSGGVSFFTQLNNDSIISCSYDKTMKIIKLIDENSFNIEQELTGHNGNVCNVIEIKENELISVSFDKTMKIWELNDEYEFECTKTITFQKTESNCNILLINKNEFATSSESDKCLKFWDSVDYSNIATIENIETEWTYKLLCMINKDILCVGGTNSKGFYLINILNHQLIKNILGPQIIYSINKCFDGLILCSIKNKSGNCAIVKYQYEKEEMKKIVEKENIHEGNIYTCFELDDETIASGGTDKWIKIWRN